MNQKATGTFNTSPKITQGLDTLLITTSKRSTDNLMKKVFTMQECYLQSNPNIYTKEEIKQICYYLKTVSYKFQLANLSLEQLWALSETKKLTELIYALENGLDRLDTSNDELLLISFAFESVLFQAMACLEFYMLYLSFFLKLVPVDYRGKMPKSKFLEKLGKAEFPTKKTKQVKEYFQTEVFGENESKNWGSLLKSLRDKIAHRDKLRPSFDSNETLIGEVLFDWPTLRDTTYERFHQSMQNGLFFLLQKLSPVLYELEWQPGPSYEC